MKSSICRKKNTQKQKQKNSWKNIHIHQKSDLLINIKRQEKNSNMEEKIIIFPPQIKEKKCLQQFNTSIKNLTLNLAIVVFVMKRNLCTWTHKMWYFKY